MTILITDRLVTPLTCPGTAGVKLVAKLADKALVFAGS
jgi:hypothetical protein